MRSFRHRPVRSDPTDRTDLSDENGNGSSNNNEEEIKRKKRGPIKLRRPPNGQQIPIRPLGEEQFEFVNDSSDMEMGIGGQITALLKLEYPSLIKENPKKTFYAKNWAHYSITKDEDGMTAADRFREEFWSIYSVDGEHRSHAEEVLERFAAKQCRNMMYELRVSVVKAYYDDVLQQLIKDIVAHKKLLREAQYLKKRRLAQDSRMQPDFAQNRGGSRPYGQTKRYLAKKYGPEAASDINTYCCLKSGVNNCDDNGKSVPIPTEKAQRCVDDFFATLEALHPDDYEQRKSEGKLDADVLYSSGNGLAHGRVPIANGAIRKCDMKKSGRTSNSTRQPSSASYQYLVRRNAHLEKGYQIGLVLIKQMPDFYAKLNMPILEEIASILREANTCAQSSEQVSQSSHAENGGYANGNGIADNGSPCRSHDNDASGSGNRDNEDDPSLE
ncbi:hypothetical protein PVAP13_2KG022016 [Panicum virgatum]|uniref:Uncharacterized protein n=1 Tax=Panicum virgatum TaxID=38727 RepID=A0A8T0VS28_PANVG|nr:hypothetical protein PVAP13_2KG022016 [Panicum virgatum]KAG2639671.1 hypothetical protein PVAP13_2KG022016 [Panicum virgatum]